MDDKSNMIFDTEKVGSASHNHTSHQILSVKSKIFIFDAVIRIPISSYFVLSDNNCKFMSRNSNLLSINIQIFDIEFE